MMKKMRPNLLSLPRLSVLLALLLAALIATSPGSAEAKSSRKVSHSYESVWPATVRFLRIDEGLKISEKDSDTGYILFEVHDDGKIYAGSVEVIRRKDYSNRDAVELVLQIKDRPSYMEIPILDRLMAKLRKELGHPKRPQPPKKDEDDPKNDSDAAAKSE